LRISMKTIMIALSVVLLGGTIAARAAEPSANGSTTTNVQPAAPAAPVTKDQILAAIAMLETNAASDAGIKAANEIVQFAQTSDQVSVHLNAEVVPWAHSKALDGKEVVSKILMAAYIGGVAKAQLHGHNTVESPYDGWILAIRAYRQMQRRKPEIVVPEIDALVAKQEKGELPSYAAEIQSKKTIP